MTHSPPTRSEAEPETETCERCQGNGEIVTDWDRYMHGPLDENGEDAVEPCPDCDGEGTLAVRTLLQETK